MLKFITLWEFSMIKTQWRMNIVLAKSWVLWFYYYWIFGKPLAHKIYHNSSIILNQKRKKTCPNQSIFFLNACQRLQSVNINTLKFYVGVMLGLPLRKRNCQRKIPLPPYIQLISNSQSLKLTRFNYLLNTRVNNADCSQLGSKFHIWNMWT